MSPAESDSEGPILRNYIKHNKRKGIIHYHNPPMNVQLDRQTIDDFIESNKDLSIIQSLVVDTLDNFKRTSKKIYAIPFIICMIPRLALMDSKLTKEKNESMLLTYPNGDITKCSLRLKGGGGSGKQKPKNIQKLYSQEVTSQFTNNKICTLLTYFEISPNAIETRIKKLEQTNIVLVDEKVDVTSAGKKCDVDKLLISLSKIISASEELNLFMVARLLLLGISLRFITEEEGGEFDYVQSMNEKARFIQKLLLKDDIVNDIHERHVLSSVDYPLDSEKIAEDNNYDFQFWLKYIDICDAYNYFVIEKLKIIVEKLDLGEKISEALDTPPLLISEGYHPDLKIFKEVSLDKSNTKQNPYVAPTKVNKNNSNDEPNTKFSEDYFDPSNLIAATSEYAIDDVIDIADNNSIINDNVNKDVIMEE
ncbi:3255_t:CDS:2 [Entrophospora sp. SA101]|nr:8228_t:CDS:2 [Entrophospora sp. SA101]CAJ0835214.1 3255_t:CDS:2 [Entrophospora sp. SA101]